MTTADKLITLAYRSILKREPDPAGLDIYRGFLAEDPIGRLEGMLDILLGSEEARARTVDPLTLVQVRSDVRSVGGSEVARVVSLGSRCNVAQHLQDFGLRDRSLPFDWIFSTPEVVVHCLEDDFELFLRPDQYEPIPLWRRTAREFNLCDHAIFRDAYGVEAMFNHRDPSQVDDYMYLQRCVMRFRGVRDSQAPTLYLVIVDAHPNPEDAYLRLSSALDCACAGPAALLFVVVTDHRSGGPLPHVRTRRVDGEHEFVLFDAVGALGGTRFDEAADALALQALLHRYRMAPSATEVGDARHSDASAGAAFGPAV